MPATRPLARRYALFPVLTTSNRASNDGTDRQRSAQHYQ
jgi:hypothetical protein